MVKWTKEKAMEIASKYKTNKEFRENEKAAYSVSQRMGWLDDFTWLEREKSKAGSWTKEKVFEISRQYDNLSDFRNKEKKAYFASVNHNWLDELTWLSRVGTDELSYEEVKERAEKFSTAQEFKDGDPEAYERATKRRWMKRFYWMEKMSKPHGYWTRERVEEEARKYDNRKDFLKGAPGAFDKAYEEGWLDEFDWLPSVVHYWTYDEVYELAKKYTYVSEFKREQGGACKVAYNNGWIKDYTWFKSPQAPKNMWTYEKCMEVARQFTTIKEFRKNFPTAYNVCMQKGWRQDMTWFAYPLPEEMHPENYTYLVYMYIDKENNSVYIGLTRGLSRRKNGHRRKGTVYDYFTSIGKPIPDPIILEDDLDYKQAQYYEGYYVENYKEAGFNVLNKMKTGGLGGNFIKYTREKCYEIASNYEYIEDFHKEAKCCYDRARKQGYLVDYHWLKRREK